MAVDFDAPSLTRTSEYLIDPREITVKPELNGRHELPEIDDIVTGFLHIGQTTPVLIGRDGKTPVLYAGHRRWRAALEITKQKLLPNGAVFKLRCVYFQGDERTAFLATISENHDRKDALPIDDAFNIVKLRRWNMTDEEIAGIYRKKTADGKPDTAWVATTATLVELAEPAMEALNSGTLKPKAAIEIAKLAKQAQKDLLGSGQKLTVASIKRAASPNGAGTTAEASANAPASRKWDKKAFCELIQGRIDGALTVQVQKMDAENAVRTVLGQILDEVQGGK